MASIGRRHYRRVCSLCRASCEPAHVLVMVRLSTGTWKKLYRTCWECGYDELAQIRAHWGEDIQPLAFHYLEAEA